MKHHGTEIGGIDFVGVAEAMGVPGARVSSVAEFEAAFGEAVARASGDAGSVGPSLIDIDLTALIPITFPLPAHQRRRDELSGTSTAATAERSRCRS